MKNLVKTFKNKRMQFVDDVEYCSIEDIRKQLVDTIIIDGSFSDVIKHSSHFIPDWVQEAIKKVNVK